MRAYESPAGLKRFFYDYDHLDRIESVELLGSPTEWYDYDDAGNITAMNLFGSVPGPEYGPRWNYATAPRFGEIPARTILGGGLTQLFTYDHVGRLQLRQHAPGSPNAESSTYSYDSGSRLIEVAHSDGSGAEFWYDNDDQLVHEVRDDGAGGSELIERFGPIQVRDGMDFVRVLPHVTLEGTQLRYILGEPDGRAAWVMTDSGGLVSEQVSTVYGLEYDAAVWGGVNSAGAWPLGGLHGAESDVSTGVMQFGVRHVTVRGDGMWMQPEPMLSLGMVGGLDKPRAFGGIYSAGNTNMYQDPDGYFVESGWDALNVAVGVVSFVSNVKEGNYGAAAVDAVGVGIDVAATVVPGVPGGAGAAIKVARGGDKVVDLVRTANRGGDVLTTGDKAVDAVKLAPDAKVTAPCSFTEGTTIATVAGDVPIDQVQRGDVVLATVRPDRPSSTWVSVAGSEGGSICSQLGRIGRRAALPALLAACGTAEAATLPASELVQVEVYDAHTSAWYDAPFGSVRVGDQVHYGGHLLQATADGYEDRGAVTLGQLADASRFWTVRTRLETPSYGDWVLVLGGGEGRVAFHAPLEEALDVGARFAYAGHVFDTRWQAGEPVVRWSGDVLARAQGGTVRGVDGVFELVIGGGGATQTLEVTPEHPFWVAGVGWLWVEDLAVGDVLRTLDGSEARVLSKDWRAGDVDVFNIAVDGAHTYSAGSKSAVLVHNCSSKASTDLRPTQDAVSGPQVDRLASDMAENGFDAAKPIKVDGDMVVDGHHRVMAADKAGVDVVTTPANASTAAKANAKESFDQVKVDPVDWYE